MSLARRVGAIVAVLVAAGCGGAYRYRIDALRPASGPPLPERARLSTPFIVATR